MSVLKKILRHVRLPIRRGPNAGRWWSVSTGSRYLRGDFVKGKASCLERLICPGETVWDIGAHRGFTVLVESRVVGPTGRVFAFEPNPDSRGLLELHLKWNAVTNAKVFPYAMGRQDGEMSFGWARDPSQTTLPALEKRASTLACHLGGEGHTVQVRHVDGLIAAGAAPAPTLMKIDVEGAELDVLDGAAALLSLFNSVSAPDSPRGPGGQQLPRHRRGGGGGASTSRSFLGMEERHSPRAPGLERENNDVGLFWTNGG